MRDETTSVWTGASLSRWRVPVAVTTTSWMVSFTATCADNVRAVNSRTSPTSHLVFIFRSRLFLNEFIKLGDGRSSGFPRLLHLPDRRSVSVVCRSKPSRGLQLQVQPRIRTGFPRIGLFVAITDHGANLAIIPFRCLNKMGIFCLSLRAVQVSHPCGGCGVKRESGVNPEQTPLL